MAMNPDGDRRSSRRTGRRRRDTRLRPGFESLEARWVPTNLPPGFTETVVATGLSEPDGDGLRPRRPDLRLPSREGRFASSRTAQLLATPFVSAECGFHAASAGCSAWRSTRISPTNHYVYLYYTVPGRPAHNRVSRFTASGNVAVPGSEVVLLDLNNLSGRHQP